MISRATNAVMQRKTGEAMASINEASPIRIVCGDRFPENVAKKNKASFLE
jgi:hypothetical protein